MNLGFGGGKVATRAAHYRACASICATVEFGSRRSVREYNRASDEMRAFVAETHHAGPDALAELLPLLDEPPADEWLAFQLLDLGVPPLATVERSLGIIRRLASGFGPDAFGAASWLQEWEARHTIPKTPSTDS